MTETETPSSDQLEGFDHPRDTYSLLGHEEAERTFLDAATSGKLPHAWLISGPAGIGKATFAYRIARYMLDAEGQGALVPSLEVPENSEASHLISAQSHPNLLVLRRPWDRTAKRFKTILTVDEMRRIQNFFGLAAGRAGWRVCIIDTADDMNAAAANALLKTLEEPPEKSLILVLAHAPGRLLPTIRSRCRHLRLSPLSDAHIDILLEHHMQGALNANERAIIARLARGSIGRALQLSEQGGVELYQELVGVLSTLPEFNRLAVLGLGAKVTKTTNSQNSVNLLFDLLSDWIQRMVVGTADEDLRQPVLEGEADLMERLGHAASPAKWADVWDELQEVHLRSQSLHMDPKQTVLQTFLKLQAVCG